MSAEKGSLAAEFYGAGLFLVYAVVLLAHHAAPSMTDYANWTYQGVLLARHVWGFPDAAHGLKAYPVPNSAATVGIGALTLLLPWTIAAKVWLCVQMGVTFAAIRHLARTIGASGAVWFVVPQAAFLGVNWWYGFVNFELGLAWVLLMASMLLRRVRGEGGRDWKIGSVLVLAFFTHMIPFAFCGLLVLLYAMQTKRWRVVWQAVPAGCLSAWYLVGRYLVAGDADGQAGMVASVRNYSVAFWEYKVNSYLKSFGFVNPGTVDGSVAVAVLGKAVFVGLFAVNALLCGLMGWLLVRAILRGLRERGEDWFLWVGAALLLPVYVLAPGTALGVSDPGSRLLQVGLALMLVLVCREGGRVLQGAAVCGLVLTLSAVVLFVRVGFVAGAAASVGAPIPRVVMGFAHVPEDDQDYFYRGLEGGDYGLGVFPTGMFLSRGVKRETPR